jgi:hypothetical protein
MLHVPTADVRGSINERRSFQFFRSRNVGNMPANFEPYSWDRLVLQFSHENSIILDCLVLLSAVYEAGDGRDVSGYDTQSKSLYTLDQYNKALRSCQLHVFTATGHQGRPHLLSYVCMDRVPTKQL